jgi:hypothetical protein
MIVDQYGVRGDGAAPALIRVSGPLASSEAWIVACYTFLIGGAEVVVEQGDSADGFIVEHFRLQLVDADRWRLAPKDWYNLGDPEFPAEELAAWPRMRVSSRKIIKSARFCRPHDHFRHFRLELQFRGEDREFMSPPVANALPADFSGVIVPRRTPNDGL